MTKYTYVLIFLSAAAICQGHKSKRSFPALPTPKLTKIITFRPPGFTVNWSPVVSDKNNPVTGFRVKAWENEKEIVYHTEEKEGLGTVWIKELRPIEKSYNIIPNTEPLVITVEGNVTEARFEGIKLNEDYQIRVQALNVDGDEGPYSNVLGITLYD